MAKSSKKSRSTRPKPPITPPSMPPFDRRLMDRTMLQIQQLMSEQDFSSAEEANAYMQQILSQGELPDLRPETPGQEAQELMYEAFDARGSRRVQLAQRALTIDPDCVDAYCLLAEETARSPREALRLYRKGVNAGERRLGPGIFEEGLGHFWGLVETRPYMRAMLGLGLVFQAVGQRDDAISTWQRMLELNPGDNQGVRDLLINTLLWEKRTKEAGKLLDQYDDSAGASWAFSRALWLFQKEGASPTAEGALRAALAANRHVIPYLVGEKELEPIPDLYSIGGPEEALVYVNQALPMWHATNGAIRWVCHFLEIDDSTA